LVPILRKGNRWNVFENMILKITSGPKTQQATGEWKKLHDEELQNFKLHRTGLLLE
jgi:hypothetical protein